MRVKVVLALVVVLVVGLGMVLVVGGSDDDPSGPPRASQAELRRLQDRINDVDGTLERNGILGATANVAESRGGACVEVTMLNPTAPNRAWLRDRFGPHVCPSTKPIGGFATTLMGCFSRERERVRVPDVVGLRADYALRRLRRAGFAEDCNNDTGARTPDRFSARNALFVSRVCTTSQIKGSVVHMDVRGRLPGGYLYIDDTCERR